MVSLVMFCLVLNDLVSAQNLIQDSCKKASAIDHYLDYIFCVKSLTENPESKAAKNLDGLILASTKKAAVEVTNFRGIIIQMLRDKRGRGIEAELRTCKIFYDNAVGDINGALTNVKSHDYGSALDHFAAAEWAPLNCEYIFRESGKKSPITHENDNLDQKMKIPHDLILYK